MSKGNGTETKSKIHKETEVVDALAEFITKCADGETFFRESADVMMQSKSVAQAIRDQVAKSGAVETMSFLIGSLEMQQDKLREIVDPDIIQKWKGERIAADNKLDLAARKLKKVEADERISVLTKQKKENEEEIKRLRAQVEIENKYILRNAGDVIMNDRKDQKEGKGRYDDKGGKKTKV